MKVIAAIRLLSPYHLIGSKRYRCSSELVIGWDDTCEFVQTAIKKFVRGRCAL